MPVKNTTFLHGLAATNRHNHQEIRLRGSIASQPLQGPKEAPGPCAHHWRIAEPNGPLSDATCRKCGADKRFRNSEAESGYGEYFGQSL